MTQEKDSASAPTAEASSAKPAAAPKPRTPRKKAPAAPAEGAATTTPAKKPVSKTTRTTAPKPAAKAAPKKTAASKADAAPAAGPAPQQKETPPAAAKPAAQKPTASRSRKAVPKAAPKDSAPVTDAAPVAVAQTAPKAVPAAVPAPAPIVDAPRNAPVKTEGQPAPETAEAPTSSGRRQRSSAAKTGGRRPAAEKKESAAPRQEAAPKERTRERALELSLTDVAPAREAAPEAAPAEAPRSGDAADRRAQDGKPASRRSRRGGRRRNKNRTAAMAADGANGAAAPDQAPSPDLSFAPAVPAVAEAPAEEAAPAPRDDDGKAAASGAKPAGKGSTRGSRGGRGGKGSRAKTQDAPALDEETPAVIDDEDDDDREKTGKASTGKRKMFISVLSGELVEVVLAEEGSVVEYYVEMHHQAKVKGNIYKGVVSNIDANLQAAFISYAGGVKNGFLQVDEVHPEYYLAHHEPLKGRKYPPIQKVLKPGQEILVQVVKEPAGTKGAFLTSYLSLPGRFLVLTPGREQIGVSRKVDSDEERSRLKGMLEGLTPGKGLGVIVRTVSEGATKTSLQRDLQFLKRLWKDVRAKGQDAPAPGLIYQELDLATRAVRDYLTDDVQEVWVDQPEIADQVTELATLLFPKKKNLVQLHQEAGSTLFERFSLQRQLDQIHSREVPLPSGGRLAIDNTEALTAIDINSGRSSGKNNFEDMAYRTNLEAAKAIPLQLRLRDIGGQVVVDFIEMRDRNHWKEVEKAVRNGMKGDRARFDVGKIGPFGLLEIVRQRLGSSAISISTEPCPCCKGTGIRRNMEWQSMQALRDINKLLRQAAANNQVSMTYETEAELAFYLLNAKRTMLRTLEDTAGVAIVIRPAG